MKNISLLIILSVFLLLNNITIQYKTFNTNANTIKNSNNNSNAYKLKLKSKLKSKDIETNTSTSNDANNTDDLQKEYLAYSDFQCVFTCLNNKQTTEEIKEAFRQKINNPDPIQFTQVKEIDPNHYCQNIKPLYTIRLTPDIVDQSEANLLCAEGGKIHSKAVEYCVKDNDCTGATVNIK